MLSHFGKFEKIQLRKSWQIWELSEKDSQLNREPFMYFLILIVQLCCQLFENVKTSIAGKDDKSEIIQLSEKSGEVKKGHLTFYVNSFLIVWHWYMAKVLQSKDSLQDYFFPCLPALLTIPIIRKEFSFSCCLSWCSCLIDGDFIIADIILDAGHVLHEKQIVKSVMKYEEMLEITIIYLQDNEPQ